jgi:hypothetical protein
MDDKELTYLDFVYAKGSKIFEAEEIRGLTPEQVVEGEKVYNILVEKLQKGEEISEGLFSGLLSAGVGALVGPTVMKSICKALGISEGSPLYNLLTSKLVLASVAYTLGK